VQYVMASTFLVIALAVFGLVALTRRENKLESRPSLGAAARSLRRSRLVVSAASGMCRCGGILGPTGTVSPRYGQLQACTRCGRTWTDSGRRIIRRRRSAGGRRTRRSRRVGPLQ
jgi:hypothetical protein